MAETTPPATPSPIVVGIDLGALTTKITLGPSHDHELVRNAHGGHATPTAVTFSGKRRARLLGEDAAEASRADGNTASALDRLLEDSLENGAGKEGKEGEEGDALAAFRRFRLIPSDAGDGAARGPRVHVPNMEEEYSTTALVTMFLGSVKRNVAATIARLEGNKGGDGGTANDDLHFVFAVPPSYPQSTRNALMDAAFGASVPRSSVVDSTECMAAVWGRKLGDAAGAGRGAALVVEMGHARSCVAVLRKATDGADVPGDGAGGPAGDRGSDAVDPGGAGGVEVLSARSSPTLGAGLVDVALYRHFLSAHPSLSHHTPESFLAGSRSAQRLLEGCRKLKHLLSMLPEAAATVENIGKNEGDVNLSCTRELLEQLCQKTVVDGLEEMIASALEEAGVAVGDIEAVEITGGGLRIPFVQETIRKAIGRGGDEGFAFSRSLDDTSLAFGASLVGAALSSSDEDAEDADMIDAGRKARRDGLLETEAVMSERDVRLRRKDEVRNQIEAHVLEFRAARHSAHGSLLPSSEEFASHLDGADDWLFSEECEEATLEEMEGKWDAVRSVTHGLCGEYLAAGRAEAERMDREMEEGARAAAAEAAANGDAGDEDHDTRRLPTKRRMEIVRKNKDEANELFSDGNYRHAAARYAKALTHCGKLFDLSPAEEQLAKETKLSLHLNMALAYIKLEKMDNAHRSCNDALELDASNVKALYRRASVLYQKRKFGDASKDLKAAEKLAPDDKAVKNLQRLVNFQIAKQKKKEKNMAKKMFG